MNQPRKLSDLDPAQRVLAEKRYHADRHRQLLIQRIVTGVALAIGVLGAIEDDLAQALLAGAIVILAGLFPILPRPSFSFNPPQPDDPSMDQTEQQAGIPPLTVVGHNVVSDRARDTKLTQLATEVSGLLTEAFRDREMSAGDIVYAGGLGINGFSRIVVAMMDIKEDQAAINAGNIEIVGQALQASMQVHRVSSLDEADELAARVKAETAQQAEGA